MDIGIAKEALPWGPFHGSWVSTVLTDLPGVPKTHVLSHAPAHPVWSPHKPFHPRPLDSGLGARHSSWASHTLLLPRLGDAPRHPTLVPVVDICSPESWRCSQLCDWQLCPSVVAETFCKCPLEVRG